MVQRFGQFLMLCGLVAGGAGVMLMHMQLIVIGCMALAAGAWIARP